MLRKSNKNKLKEYFFMHPTEKLRIREIERRAKVTLPSVVRYVKELEDEKILTSTVISGVKLYFADRTSKQFLLEKKLFNIKFLHDSGLVDFLVNGLENPAIVLFGSYSRGEDTEESDIDLYIEKHLEYELKLDAFEKKLNKKIQLFCYKSIKQVKNEHLANNIINGITLNGFLEAFK